MNKEFDMTKEEEFNYRLNNRTKKELELAKKHNCSGLCYGCRFECPKVDTCPETCVREFIATIIAVVSCLLFIPLTIAFIVYLVLL